MWTSRQNIKALLRLAAERQNKVALEFNDLSAAHQKKTCALCDITKGWFLWNKQERERGSYISMSVVDGS